jgi:hypothetical protein
MEYLAEQAAGADGDQVSFIHSIYSDQALSSEHIERARQLAHTRVTARTRQAETVLDRLAPWIESCKRQQLLKADLDAKVAQKDAALKLVSIDASLKRY